MSYLVDRNGQKLIKLIDLEFDPKSAAFIGKIESIAMPLELSTLLAELEELVEGQTFALVDEVQKKIDDLQITVVFEDGSSRPIKDLYVASDNGVSFREAVPI